MVSASAGLLAVAGGILGSATVAQGVPVECAPGTEWDPIEGQCLVVVTQPADPGGGGGTRSPGDGGDGGSAAPAVPLPCVQVTDDIEVPCEISGGWWWVQAWNAYAKLSDPQPPRSDPVWSGNDDGAVYDRGLWMGNPALDPGLINQAWSLTPPWVELPDPRVLAQQAITAMDLQAITIGVVPEDVPGSVGLLGLPTWMWAESPTDNTMGPITRSASAGGYTVTATGRVQKIVWDMGDGASVTCTGPGTPYADSYMDFDSPTCGHRYQQQGEHRVSARSHWVISWTGMGQSGTIPLELADDTTITMGEAQVLGYEP